MTAKSTKNPLTNPGQIVIALDSFKGTLSAAEACALVARVIRSTCPGHTVLEHPMADGGEGTADALVAACGGRLVLLPNLIGPLPDMRVASDYAWLPQQKTAVVEMARASGLPLLRPAKRNPMLTTTYGTGQLIAAAAQAGAREILLTLGGSATVDGGTGAARALGWQFLDHNGEAVPQGGQGLARIQRIVRPDPTTNSPLPTIKALCDVDNPLYGPRGAAAVYGPQKGATPAMVRQLEDGLRNLADRMQQDLGLDVADLPGAGAAGGFGAGAAAFLNAALVPGVEAVADASGLDRALAGAAWVITGEGRFDEQSLQGKVVCGVRNHARRHDVRVAVLAGRIALDEHTMHAADIALAEACAPPQMPDADAFAKTHELLEAAATRLVARLRKLQQYSTP